MTQGSEPPRQSMGRCSAVRTASIDRPCRGDRLIEEAPATRREPWSWGGQAPTEHASILVDSPPCWLHDLSPEVSCASPKACRGSPRPVVVDARVGKENGVQGVIGWWRDRTTSVTSPGWYPSDTSGSMIAARDMTRRRSITTSTSPSRTRLTVVPTLVPARQVSLAQHAPAMPIKR
jgi:hypothetical protein